MILLIIFFAYIIFIITSMQYFWHEKKKCQRYKFYALRDKLIWEKITSNSLDDKLYKATNYVVNHLKKLNFSFYGKAITMFTEDVLEINYKIDSLNLKFDIKKLTKISLSPDELEFAILLLNTARKNSILLRLAMTKIGYLILFLPYNIKGFIKFISKHPELAKKPRNDMKIVKEYSYLSQALKIA